MITELDNETLTFLCERKLTFSQFVICLLVYKKDYASIIKYSNEIGYIGDTYIKSSKGYIKELDDLIERGYLLYHGAKDKKDYELDDFILSPSFTDGFLVDIEDVCKELWDAYPKHLLIQGNLVNAKVADYDEFSIKYLKTINNRIKKHKEVMEKLKIMLNITPYAPMSIMNFVGSRHWENIDGDATKPKSRSY